MQWEIGLNFVILMPCRLVHATFVSCFRCEIVCHVFFTLSWSCIVMCNQVPGNQIMSIMWYEMNIVKSKYDWFVGIFNQTHIWTNCRPGQKTHLQSKHTKCQNGLGQQISLCLNVFNNSWSIWKHVKFRWLHNVQLPECYLQGFPSHGEDPPGFNGRVERTNFNLFLFSSAGRLPERTFGRQIVFSGAQTWPWFAFNFYFRPDCMTFACSQCARGSLTCSSPHWQ